MAGKASADSLFSAVGWSEEASGNPAPSPITAQQDIAIDLGGDPIIDLSTPTIPHEPQPQPVGPPPVHESIASHQTRAPDQNAAPPSAPQLAAPQLAETHLAESHLAETQLAETNLAESHLAETQPPELLPPAQWRLFDISDAAPSGMGVVAWSTTALARLGLPPAVVEAVVGLDPRDDLGWINGLAGALAPLCGPVPKQPTVVVGANADQLAEALAMPVLKPPELPPYSGSFGAVVAAQASDLAWLEHVRGDRPIHVVIGDAPWRDLLLADPVAVSWAGETAVVDAVYLASTLRCVLGFGSVDGFLSSMVKVTPIDVALAIRRLVGRR